MRFRWVGKRALVVALLTTLCAPHLVQAQAPQGIPQPAQIDRNGTLILIRSTLIALQQANETGNYTVLRDLGAPGFREVNSAARLGEIFANLRGQKLDLAGILVLDPQLTLLPQVENNGLMRMSGFFPSVPAQINFDLVFAPVDGRWRLFGVSVGLGSSSPVAPNPPKPAATATPAKPQPTPKAGTGRSKPGAAKPSKRPAEPKPDSKSPETSVAPEPSGGATLDRKQ